MCSIDINTEMQICIQTMPHSRFGRGLPAGFQVKYSHAEQCILQNIQLQKSFS